MSSKYSICEKALMSHCLSVFYPSLMVSSLNKLTFCYKSKIVILTNNTYVAKLGWICILNFETKENKIITTHFYLFITCRTFSNIYIIFSSQEPWEEHLFIICILQLAKEFYKSYIIYWQLQCSDCQD